MLYAFAFLLLAVSVLLLYAAPAFTVYKTAARSGFLISLLLYILSWFADSGSWWYRLIFILPRDLTIFTLILIIATKFAPRPRFLYAGAVVLAGVIYFSFFGRLKQSFSPVPDGRYEFLVDAREGVQPAALQAYAARFGGTAEPAFPGIGVPGDTFLDEYWIVDIPSQYGLMYSFIRRVMAGSGLFDDVEFNDAVAASPLVGSDRVSGGTDLGVDDPRAPEQWALDRLGGRAWFDGLKQLPEPEKSVVLAVLDTGVDTSHEDLQGAVSGDGPDVVGHGTHVAGIAAAATNNGRGISSLPGSIVPVTVLSIKVLNDAGTGTEQSVIQGVLRAADAGAGVISMSLGGPTRDSYQRAMEEAVAYAARRGAIVLAAAGNDGGDAARFVPANASGVIAVTALGPDLKPAAFTNSVHAVEMGIAAPGVDILSTWPGNGYRPLSGTSMATPYAAACAALVKAYRPEITTRELWLLMTRTGAQTSDLDKTGAFIQPGNLLQTILSPSAP